MPSFQDLLADAQKKLEAEPSRTEYWQGYIRGLYRGHYGHDAGLDEEREWQVEESEDYVNGHGDGYHAASMADSADRVN
jgi:hypothetical protein